MITSNTNLKRKIVVERKWEFVTVDRPAAQQNAATRKRVRVGAMRAFRRKETLERIEAFQREKMTGSIAQDSSPTDSALSRRGSSATDRFQPSAEVSFRSVAAMPRSIVPHRDSLTCTSDRDHASGSFDFVVEKKDLGYLPGLPEIKTLDPCGTRSLGLNNSQHFLLHHFTSVMSLRPFRFTAKKEQSPIGTSWARHVLQDKILLDATLLNAAVHLDNLCKRPAGALTLRLRGETIRSVNKKLECAEFSERASDSVIGAIVLMAWSVNYSGDLEELKLHMDALMKLVGVRGGLEQLGLGGILHMFITRLDLISAALTMSAPRFTFTDNHPSSESVPISHPNPKDYNVSAILDVLRDPLPGIYREIRQLMMMQDGFGTDEVTRGDLTLFGKRRSLVSHRLLSTPETTPLTAENDYQSRLYPSCRMAGLIFVEYMLAGRLPRRDILRFFGSKLLYFLQTALMSPQVLQGLSRDHFSSKVILWVFFIGGIASLDISETQWYAGRICHTMNQLGMSTWQELKSCLAELLWTDKMEDQACQDLWEAVRRSRVGSME